MLHSDNATTTATTDENDQNDRHNETERERVKRLNAAFQALRARMRTPTSMSKEAVLTTAIVRVAERQAGDSLDTLIDGVIGSDVDGEAPERPVVVARRAKPCVSAIRRKHAAIERRRIRKMNTLYTTLRETLGLRVDASKEQILLATIAMVHTNGGP